MGKRDSIVAVNLKKLYDSGIKIAVANDAGNPFTFHGISSYDEMEAMQDIGNTRIRSNCYGHQERSHDHEQA